MTEFGLVLSIFLTLAFSIIDFGSASAAWLTFTNSSREVARLGTVRAPASGACDYDPSTKADNIRCRVYETASSLDQSKLTVSSTGAQGTPGDSVVVKVDYDYDLITPLDNMLGLISGGKLGPTLKFTSTADMRLE